jgi:hypothetical protein
MAKVVKVIELDGQAKKPSEWGRASQTPYKIRKEFLFLGSEQREQDHVAD